MHEHRFLMDAAPILLRSGDAVPFWCYLFVCECNGVQLWPREHFDQATDAARAELLQRLTGQGLQLLTPDVTVTLPVTE